MELFFIVVGCSVMCFTIGMFTGANDVANSLSTSVGSKSISFKYALSLAFIFEIVGATLLGSSVTNFLKNKIMVLSEFKNEPELLALGMLSCSFSIAVWLIGATFAKLPVSTTHSIIGSLIGFGLTTRRYSSINWLYLFLVILSWILVPLITVIISCLCYVFMLWLISKYSDFFNKFVLIFCSLACFPFSIFLVYKHPLIRHKLNKNTNGFIYFVNSYKNALFFIIYLTLVLFSTLFVLYLTRYRIKTGYKHTVESDIINMKHQETDETNIVIYQDNFSTPTEEGYSTPEMVLSSMQVIGTILKVISHASNDSANAAMPVAIILSIYLNNFQDKFYIPWYILFLSGVSMSFGLILFGKGVLDTVGSKLTIVVPSKGYVIDSVVSAIVLFFSFLGIPLSSTHCLVSAILGAGIVIPNYFEVNNKENDNSSDLELNEDKYHKPPNNFLRHCGLYKIFSLERVNISLFKRILIAWIVTIIFSAACSSITFYLIKNLLM